jgi:hypothetical protein
MKSTVRGRGLNRHRSDLSFTGDSSSPTAATASVELSVAELDKSQGEQEQVGPEVKRPPERNNNQPEPEPEPDY